MKNKKYEELHAHDGTKNYEVSTLVPKQNVASNIHFDTVQNLIIANSNYRAINKKDRTYESLKVNSMGEIIDKNEINGILKDGTMTGFDYYSNWIINGDKTEHKYIDPISNKIIDDPYDYKWSEKDYGKWLTIFKDLYDKADYVHINISFYQFKIGEKWYILNDNLEESTKELRQRYPSKENQKARLGKLRDICPDFYVNEYNRDTSFMNVVDYEETDSEDGGWFNPISYSAGNYFIELYMPLGDTIKIKRHGSMGVNMQAYKIPVTHGGRNDVVFLVQEPNKLYPGKEFGGMYVVRPRNPDQEQYGPHKSIADSYVGQYDSLKGNIDVKAKFLKPTGD